MIPPTAEFLAKLTERVTLRLRLAQISELSRGVRSDSKWDEIAAIADVPPVGDFDAQRQQPLPKRGGVPTFRQMAVCRLYAEGKSNDDIAAALDLKPDTIHTILIRARQRCGMGKHTNVEMIADLRSRGLIESASCGSMPAVAGGAVEPGGALVRAVADGAAFADGHDLALHGDGQRDHRVPGPVA